MSRRTSVKWLYGFLLAIPACLFLVNGMGGYTGPYAAVFSIAFFRLITGWAFFLARVLPDVTVDWISVGIAGVCLVGLSVGLHLFCGWLHREIMTKKAQKDLGPNEQVPSLPAWKLRTTMSILGIVVLMFVAGISAVGGVHQIIWLKTST